MGDRNLEPFALPSMEEMKDAAVAIGTFNAAIAATLLLVGIEDAMALSEPRGDETEDFQRAALISLASAAMSLYGCGYDFALSERKEQP